MKVTGASLVNGLLTIDLRREIPEEMKPRKIEIGSRNGKAGSRIETKATEAVDKPVAEKQAA